MLRVEAWGDGVLPRRTSEKYSLWLVPGGEVYERLASLLDVLSVRHGSPRFAPHVTLLGSIAAPRHEVLQKAAQLAAALRAFPLRLERIDYLDEYFRCLFVRVALTRPLRDAYRRTCGIFSCGNPHSFMPHLSLLYGNFGPELKEAVKAEFGPRLDLAFKARCLHVYSTQGETHRWRRVARFGVE